MNRWLALRRWLLLGLTAVLVCLRIVIEVVFHILDEGRVAAGPAGLAILIVFSIAMCIAAVATIVAFVQHGRIFNPRIPTE